MADTKPLLTNYNATAILTPYPEVDGDCFPFLNVPFKTFELDLQAENRDRALEHVYFLLNAGEEGDAPDPRAVEYRERGNRSLSIGDMVLLREREEEEKFLGLFLCQSVGWKKLV